MGLQGEETVTDFRSIILEPLLHWRANVYKETGIQPSAMVTLPSELFDRLALEMDAKAYVDSFTYASIEVRRERPIHWSVEVIGDGPANR